MLDYAVSETKVMVRL